MCSRQITYGNPSVQIILHVHFICNLVLFHGSLILLLIGKTCTMEQNHFYEKN